MGEDDRKPRRIGDDTRQRIDDLAGGWSVGSPATRADKPESGRGRSEDVTLPRPPAPAPPTGARSTADKVAPPPSAPPPVRPPPKEPAPAPTRTAPPSPLTSPAIALDTAPVPREDATTLMSDAPAGAKAAAGATFGALPAARPRKGLGADVRYVASITLGVARARRELAAVEAAVTAERAARDEVLVAIGAAAVTDDALAHPALDAAREELAALEEERAGHAGAAAAAESEIAAQRRDRERDAAELATAVAAGAAELAAIEAKLAPLERDAQAARRRAAEVKDTLASIDRRIAAAEASLVAVKKRSDPTTVAAELATLRADRVAVAADQPAIDAELDALQPRIADLTADRAAVDRRLRELREADAQAARRTDEICAAIAARKKVVDSAVGDAEARRRTALHALGERLHLDRVAGLGERAAAIDAHDLAIATGERRALELKDVLASVDRKAFGRGALVIGAVAALLIALAWWLL